MNAKEAIESLSLKFTSGNDFPVERAIITDKEWNTLKEYMMELEEYILELEEYKWMYLGLTK